MSRVLVTGGASFIGSHLAGAIVRRGDDVRVADDLSSGSLANLRAEGVLADVELLDGDLRDPSAAAAACDGAEVVFHLAADHGGRGYVDRHQAGPASNMALDVTLFRAAVDAGSAQVVFASSGCVYPDHLQTDPAEQLFLREEQVGPPYDPDNMYGWAKLSGERALAACHREYGIGAVSCRYFTVYGPRAREDHALLALVARCLVRQTPFEIWGDGRQVRGWTYVDDIVRGTLLAADRVRDARAVNLGAKERVTVREAAELAQELTGHRAPIVTRPDMPTGPVNRVADPALARSLLGWEPLIGLRDGLARTVESYLMTHRADDVARRLEAGALMGNRA